MNRFESLEAALDKWFDKHLDGLPDVLRQRVERDFFPMPWGDMSPDQRRDMAQQWDFRHDPATREERKFWWDMAERRSEFERQIEKWQSIDTPTASDLALKEKRLVELGQELTRIEQLTKDKLGSAAGVKQKGHLNHDHEMQRRANEIAAEKQKETGRLPTRDKVAKLLADELGKNVDTVLRRIRKQW